jgi:hypothetical protein
MNSHLLQNLCFWDFNGFPCPTSIFLFFLSFSPFLIGLLESIPACINLDGIALYLTTDYRQWFCHGRVVSPNYGAPHLQKASCRQLG